MDIDAATELRTLSETANILCQGLHQLTLTMGNHGEMLSQILAAVAEREEDGDSPLVQALTQLVKVGEMNTAALARIEAHIQKQAAR